MATLRSSALPWVSMGVFLAAGAHAQSTSKLWGSDGSKWTPQSRLPDFSFAGYHCGESPIPSVPLAANVKEFGAKGDGKTDDTEAIRKAIESTQQGAILVPAGRYVLTGQLAINRSGIVLRGEGIGRTVFYIPKSLEEIHGSAKIDGYKSAWSFAGGFVEFQGDQKGDLLAEVTIPAKRGDSKLTLSRTEGITPGSWVRLLMNNDPALGRYLHADQADAGPATLDECRGHLCDWAARVKAVEGSAIVLDRPLRLNVKLEWAPEIYSWQPIVEEAGLEGITFEFKGTEKKPHLEEEGFNAVQMGNAVNCWVRNIEVIDADCGVLVFGSRFCAIEGFQAKTARRRGAETGHHALWVKGSQDCLVTGFAIKTTYSHDLSVEGFANGNVFEAGEAVAIAFDHHASAPYENLFTQIKTGDPARFWNSSGHESRGPHAGARTTFWNVDYKRGVLPPVPAWPQINVIGVKRAGSSSSGKRNEWIEQAGNINPPNLYRAQLQRRLKTVSGLKRKSL
jgi:hypothetical protein